MTTSDGRKATPGGSEAVVAAEKKGTDGILAGANVMRILQATSPGSLTSRMESLEP
jgi:hypothetical protein